ncbi:arp2/3 complex-activating protein rickA-like [Episyrphus balteatus]|uniref:arp2/3 complex-activating protein rickA-like n=1 Tax=Episyrphus balteatus TaxID=286459 RepID=UPI002486BE36|nr:arp2/3 complex-activating protein rickA-like [Episyrphus balteatus]
METPNSNVSLKRTRNDEIGSFKIIHTDTDTDDNSINGNANKKKIISEYKIVYNETRQSNRHKNPSGVWKYFALATKDTSTGDNNFKDEPDDRVLCMLCYNKGRVHVYKSKTSSSNLWKHLNRKHDIEIPTERMFAVSTSSLDRFEFNSEEIDDGNSSNDCQLPVLDEENNDVLIKADDFDGIEEYTEEEEDEQNIQSSLSNEMIEENILRYEISSSRMTKDIGLAIIEEVAKRPILYEVQMSKLSTVKATKKVMWEEVYDALGQIVPIERIQKIWKNIRDRYKKIRNIERDGMKCIAKYKYYDHLGFLDDDEQLGCQLSDVEFEEQPEEKKPRPEDFSFLIEQTDSILTSVDDLVQNDQNYTTEDVVSETSSNCIVSSSNPPTITTTIYPMEMNPNNSDVIIAKPPPTPATAPPQTAPPPPQQPETPPVSNNTEQMDEFDLFGKLIANKLRNAPRDRVNLIEVKIMQAILENT